MKKYTIVGLHFNGLGIVLHCKASTANEALSNFDSQDSGIVTAIFDGHLTNRVHRQLIPGSPTELESEEDNKTNGSD